MKKTIKVYLEEEDIKKLREKAIALFGNQRGIINRYLEKIAREDLCFLDSNTKTLLKALNLTTTPKHPQK